MKIDSGASHFQLQFTPVQIGEYQFEPQGLGSLSSVTEFRFRLPKISAQERQKLSGVKHPWLSAIEVTDVDQLTLLTLRLNPQVASNLEVFPYLTDQPYRLIIDIYPSQDPKTLGQSKKSSLEPQVSNLNKPQPTGDSRFRGTAASSKLREREVSSTDIMVIEPSSEAVNPSQLERAARPLNLGSGAFDGDDPHFERFQIRADQLPPQAVYLNRKARMDFLEFSLLEDPLQEFQEIRRKAPYYQVLENPTLKGEAKREADEAKLLLTLFENKRYFVFLETLKKFRKKYPDSNFHKMFRYMEAEVNYSLFEMSRNLDFFELSMAQYRQAIQQYSSPDLEKHTKLFIAFAHYDRGDFLNAIRLFREITGLYPNSEIHDLAELFRGLAHIKINQFPMASSILSELIKKTESTIIKQRSLACLGNIYFLQGDPKKAIQIYKPLSQNQEFIEKFPSLLFNLATAQFQSEALPESLETFVQFFKRHPDHSHGALAMLRIAELFEVFGQPRDRVFRILREAQFRYSPEPPHLGAAARMRFLSMRFPLMKSAELKSAIAEIKNLSKSLSFPNAREWMSFITSDGLVEAMDFEQALKILAQYLQNYPTTLSKARFQDKIQEVIHQKLKYLLGRKEHVQVLSTHEHHQGLWLKDKQRVDTQFLIGRAYEELGLFDQAIRFYEHLSNSQDDSRVTVSVFDRPPPQPQLQLRLGVALTYSGQSERAIQTLSGIEAIAKNLSLDEQAERAVAMVKALTDRGELNRALNFLSPLIETHPDGSLSRAQLSFQKNLLLKKTGAIGSYLQEQEALTEKLRDRSDGRDLYQQVLIETLEFLSSIESPTPTQKKLREERLSEFVAEFAKDGQFNQWRYALGFLNFENGQIEEARKNWGPLLKPDSAGDLSFWGKRAKDWLAQSDWEKEKKDLMSRIPAAQSSSEILRE